MSTSPKFIQFVATPVKDGHTLYALDENGDGWLYDGTQRTWLALGRERLASAPAHGIRP